MSVLKLTSGNGTDFVFDSLPYLDSVPSEEEKEKAKKLIAEELESSYTNINKIHSTVTPIEKLKVGPGLNIALENLDNSTLQNLDSGIKCIDLSKYDNFTLNEEEFKGLSEEEKNQKLQNLLNRLYISLEYNHDRKENLQLLNEYGKNQWLVSNDNLTLKIKQMEDILQNQLLFVDRINGSRKRKQLDIKEMESYFKNRWSSGIDKVVQLSAVVETQRRLKRVSV